MSEGRDASTDKLYLKGDCYFEVQRYFNGAKYLTMEYTEHAHDGYYSDTDTSVDISENKAREIIDFLQKFINR